MKREELEHIIRAAAAITNCREVVIVGSQAILGTFPNAPPELLTSMEADIYPLSDPAKADLIDGSIGELSPFHEEFGYYAHGVGPETAQLPRNWRQRTVAIAAPDTGGATGLCLSLSDLAVSKLLAGRQRDLAFVSAMLRNKLVRTTDIEEMFSELSLDQAKLVRVRLSPCA